MFQIERGVAIPQRIGFGIFGIGRPRLYPFDEMEVGDSFFAPCGLSEVPTVVNRLNSASRHARKRGREFTTRRYTEGTIGVRIWRTA